MSNYIANTVPTLGEDTFAELAVRLGALADELWKDAETVRNRQRDTTLQRHLVGAYDELARIIEQRGKREAECLKETAQAVESILFACIQARFSKGN